MGQVKPYPLVKYICAITIADKTLWEKVQVQLTDLLSPFDLMTDWFPFNYTEYYTPEMGPGLEKRLVSFRELSLAEHLPAIKLATNQIEEQLSLEGKRRVNLDPGYLTASRLVLATTKDYAHRVYLGQGIFGDVHLRFRGGQYEPLEWTYPDYREPFVRQFLKDVRDVYLTQLGEIEELLR